MMRIERLYMGWSDKKNTVQKVFGTRGQCSLFKNCFKWNQNSNRKFFSGWMQTWNYFEPEELPEIKSNSRIFNI